MVILFSAKLNWGSKIVGEKPYQGLPNLGPKPNVFGVLVPMNFSEVNCNLNI